MTLIQEQVDDLAEEEPVVLKSGPDQVLSFTVQAIRATSSSTNVTLLPCVWVMGQPITQGSLDHPLPSHQGASELFPSGFIMSKTPLDSNHEASWPDVP